MAKKNKQFDEIQKIGIETIKKYLDNYVAASPDAYSVEYESKNADEVFCFISTVTYQSFKAIIKYYYKVIMAEYVMDVSFAYEGCPYAFSIYNIFNLFEIDDFNNYCYQNCIGSASVTNAVKNLTNLVENHYRDIKEAGSQTYLPTLISQFEEDQLVANGDEWKEEISDPDRLDFTDIFYLTTTAKSEEKLIQKLEKYERKDELVIYEKRLLKYLKAGHKMPQSTDSSAKFEKESKKVKTKIYFIVAVIVCIVLSAAEFVAYRLIYADGFVLWNDMLDLGTDSFGVQIPFSVIFFIASVVFMSWFFIFVVGKRIVRKICSDDVNDYIEAKENQNNGSKKFDKISRKYLAPAGCFVLSVILFFTANIGISLNDEGIRCHQFPFVIEKADYDEVKIYSLEQLYDSDKEKFVDVDGVCYAIGWDDNYYILAKCDEGSKIDEKIKETAQKHGKQIITIENDFTLDKIYFNS